MKLFQNFSFWNRLKSLCHKDLAGLRTARSKTAYHFSAKMLFEVPMKRRFVVFIVFLLRGALFSQETVSFIEITTDGKSAGLIYGEQRSYQNTALRKAVSDELERTRQKPEIVKKTDGEAVYYSFEASLIDDDDLLLNRYWNLEQR
jgi:hypothetical protein